MPFPALALRHSEGPVVRSPGPWLRNSRPGVLGPESLDNYRRAVLADAARFAAVFIYDGVIIVGD